MSLIEEPHIVLRIYRTLFLRYRSPEYNPSEVNPNIDQAGEVHLCSRSANAGNAWRNCSLPGQMKLTQFRLVFDFKEDKGIQ
jgi:hypothetical protein